MGFSSALQGPASHEALLSRQDAELRLLETMRRCLALRIKADRDYAVALSSSLLQASSGNPEVMTGSQVLKTWVTFSEETDKMAKYVKEGAEFLAGTLLEKINELYSEKKANRKQYQEESLRIANELRQLQDSVNKTKSEYEKCLETHANVKMKFEEQCSTRGRVGKKYEDLRERYLKACKKLHLTHNEYVLLLCEASEYERDTRTILLPGLLEHQQAIQEDMIQKWRIILKEIQRSCNFSDKKYQDLQEKIGTAVDSIKSGDEYSKFIELNKTTPPPPIPFQFEPTLAENNKNKLNPNGVVLDDLTVDMLKSKLAENEAKLTECRSQIQDKQTQIIQYETELSTVKFKSDQVSIGRTFSIKKIADVLKKEVNELRCKEQKLTRQNELIQAPFNEVGDEIPLGCDWLTESDTFDVNSANTRSGVKKPGQVMTMLRKPFGIVKSSSSSHSLSGLSGSKQDFNNQDFDSLENANSQDNLKVDHVDFKPVRAPISVHDPLSFEEGRPLDEELWFHGVLPRDEVVRLLKVDGDFLVRETTRNDAKQVVLSVMWTSPKHFIVQTSPDGQFRFEGPSFNTVQELIIYQFHCGSPVTSRSGAVLKTPILREEWELNNDDVELLEKIGRGNFGDVYKANLSPANLPVAVKTCKATLAEEQKKKVLQFLQEGRILKQYDHPNIVRFIGICVQKQPIMIVMELVSGGSLLNYLRNNGSRLNQKSLLGMCLDAAAGMQYLESKNCIHRDLAARNCLVGEANVVKISDFGMSREEEEYTVSDGLKQIPIKWTAPEALNYGKYTSLCDVWSYGVLCWEIFSKGGTPYQGMTNTRAREMLDSGYRMPCPDAAPDEMYKLMLRCWKYDPDDRPHFSEIHSQVDLLYSRASVGPETRV